MVLERRTNAVTSPFGVTGALNKDIKTLYIKDLVRMVNIRDT